MDTYDFVAQTPAERRVSSWKAPRGFVQFHVIWWEGMKDLIHPSKPPQPVPNPTNVLQCEKMEAQTWQLER